MSHRQDAISILEHATTVDIGGQTERYLLARAQVLALLAIAEAIDQLADGVVEELRPLTRVAEAINTITVAAGDPGDFDLRARQP